MSQGRIVPLVGPLLVLYLTLEVVGSSDTLDFSALGVCAFGLGLSSVPFLALRKFGKAVGARRIAVLAVASGVGLIRFAEPILSSMYVDLTAAVALPLVGGLTAHLALDAPDRPPALKRWRGATYLVAALGTMAAIGSALSVAPAEWLGSFLVPARWALAAPGFLLFGWTVALVLRLARRRLGSTPEALAAGGSAYLGTLSALAAGLAAFALVASGTFALDAIGVRGLVVAALVTLVSGHVAMLGARRQVHAGRNARTVIAAVLALSLVGLGASWLAFEVPREPVPFGVAVGFAAAVAGVLHRAFARIVDRLLAPFSGRLVRGCEEAMNDAVGATSFEELGASVLPPLRLATKDLDAEPLLIALDPPRRVQVDAASVAHVEARGLSAALRERLTQKPGEVIVAAPLVEQVVRRADLRGIVEALETLDALCVVPLSIDMELEGALVVARGHRRAALTLEEIDALERLGRQLSGQVAMLSAQERARERTRDAVVERNRLAEELEAAQEELGKLRADTRILKAGGAAERYSTPAIAYSPAMREVMRRVDAVGPLGAPVLLVGEEGSAPDRIAHRIHGVGGRREGPFVVADCAAVRPERADSALFGESDPTRPGWLRLAEGGTCLLLDIPALSLTAQAKLAESLATRRAVLADGAGSYAVDTRVIATSRVDLAPLAAAGAFDAELWRRLEPLVVPVPPLRERRQDLPSLVLLALDRACRTAGRPVVGMDPLALAVLVEHDWPGNLDELESVIHRAVAHTRGTTVGKDDLPSLAPVGAPHDPWEGTYLEIEARILQNALERSEGNKSEAARLLGLKRTTFLDKLKRHDLAGAPSPKRTSKTPGTAA